MKAISNNMPTEKYGEKKSISLQMVQKTIAFLEIFIDVSCFFTSRNVPRILKLCNPVSFSMLQKFS